MTQAHIAIIIILVAMVSFALEKIPLVATAMVAATAMVLFGIMPASDAYASFGSNVVIMVAGMMIVGNAVFQTGAASKFGKTLEKTNLVKNERVFIMAICMIVGLLSAFASNSAIVAMFIPVAASVSSTSGSKISQKNLIMPIGMASVIGGAIALSGSTPQVIAQQTLSDMNMQTLGFFTIGKVAFPRLVAVALYFGTIGYSLMKKTFININDSDHILQDEDTIETNKFKQWGSVLIMVGTIIGLISGKYTLGFWAMLGVTLLLVLKIVTPREAFHGVDWNTVILLGAAQGFAKGLNVSGGGELIANTIVNALGGAENASPLMITTILIIACAIITNIVSDTALTTMLVPIAANIAQTLNIDPLAIVIGIAVGVCGCFTPVGTAAMTQTLVGGYKFMDYVKVCFPLWVILTIISVVLTPIMYPF